MVKARKEVVEGVWQCVVCLVGGCVAVLVAGQSLSSATCSDRLVI